MEDDFHLVTVATHSQSYFPSLQKSCERNRMALQVLGWNTPWKGFLYKYELMLEYVQNIPPHDIVMYIDAFDVVILSGQQEIVEKYKRLGDGKIVFGCVPKRSAIAKWFHDIVFGPCDLNSGVFVGRAHAMKELLQKAMRVAQAIHCSDDQIVMTFLYESAPHHHHIILDLESQLAFNCLSKNPTQFQFQNDRVVLDKSQPCVLHGPAHINLNPILEQIHLPTIPRTFRDQLQYLKYSGAMTFVKSEDGQAAVWVLVLIGLIVLVIVKGK